MFELVFVLYLSWYLCVSAGPTEGFKDERKPNKKEKSSRLKEICKKQTVYFTSVLYVNLWEINAAMSSVLVSYSDEN